MIVIAWILVAAPIILALHTYLLYPAILRALAHPDATGAGAAASAAPLVTIVIPAYNEEAQIRFAVEALLAQDYPQGRRQILVVSDASSDATDDIVRGYADRGVELLRMPTRGGKTAAENASVARIRGDIVVNTDSSVQLHPEAVRHLVAGLADPRVGVASTRDISVAGTERSNRAEAGYVGYEMGIRALETRTGGIVGASGSGYAIRTELHRYGVREDLSRDFSAALTAHRHGFRAISVESAICYVPRTASLRQEYRRKVRTISRGMETLYFNRDLLNPVRHGAFAWKLFSHKLCRWLVPVSALPAVVGLGILAQSQEWSRWVLAAAGVAAILAITGARWPDSRPLPRGIAAGLLGALAANLAVIHSAWRFVHGHDDHIWEPTRRARGHREKPTVSA